MPEEDSGAGEMQIRSTSRSTDRFENGPLLIGEIPAPECSKSKPSPGTLILHLNDVHHWTRERIAAWVADPNVPQDESHAQY
jgi:hypothetical protein